MPVAAHIEELFSLLHIDVIGRIEAAHSAIRESVEVPAVVRDFEEFKELTTAYVQYHNAMWHGTEPGADRAWAQVRQILDTLPPPHPSLSRVRGFLDAQGSYIQAVSDSTTGRHGGLITIIDTIAEGIKREAVQQWVQSVFLTCINPLDFDAKVAFARQYLERYGHVLLGEERMISPYELAGQLEGLVETHVRVINELRNRLQ